MDTCFKKRIRKCHIESARDNNLLYKYCDDPDLYHLYADGFRQEYASMKVLEKKAPSEYAGLFPRYHSVDTSENGAPYICMERIDGIPLEDILAAKNSDDGTQPRLLFTYGQLSHICRQVFHALCFLCGDDIFYFDLLPCNIIVVDDQKYDIRLIDFTFCYHHPFQEDRRYKIMDRRLDCSFPLPLRIENAFMLFFTRLFYCGESCYNEYFHPHSPDSQTGIFFRKKFGEELLRPLLDAPDDERKTLIEEFSAPSCNIRESSLLCLRNWHDRLQQHLRYLESRCS